MIEVFDVQAEALPVLRKVSSIFSAVPFRQLDPRPFFDRLFGSDHVVRRICAAHVNLLRDRDAIMMLGDVRTQL